VPDKTSEPATAGERLEISRWRPFHGLGLVFCDLILGLTPQALYLRLLRRLTDFCAKPSGGRDSLSRGLNPSRPFVGNNLWVTSFTDPDGYRLDFESPTDVPEETVYSDPT
jgi:hypothetical protein